jgi:hypothetical protein
VTDTAEGLIPSFSQRAKEANLPEIMQAGDLLEKEIIVLEWEPSDAMVPETGQITHGFQVTSHVVDTDETVSWFCGQKALVRALKAVKPPFRTVIRKQGRTYLFS